MDTLRKSSNGSHGHLYNPEYEVVTNEVMQN